MKRLLNLVILLFLCMASFATETYVVNSKNLNMRAKPIGTSKKLGSLKKGDLVQVEKIADGWATCVNEAGETFYVSSKFLKATNPSTPTDNATESQNSDEEDVGDVDMKDPAVIIQRQMLKALSSVGIHIKQSKSTRFFESMLIMPLLIFFFSWLFGKLLGIWHMEQYAYLAGLALLGYLELKCMLFYSGNPGFFVHNELFSIVFWLFMLTILFLVQSLFLGLAGNDEVRFAESHVGTITVFGCGALYLVTCLFLSFLQPWIILLFFIGIAYHLILMFVRGDKGLKGLFFFFFYVLFYVLAALSTFLFMVMFIGHMVYLMGWIGSIIFILALLALGGGEGPTIIAFIIKK